MTEQKNEGKESKIVKLILETGYECCASVESARELLADNTIDEKDIAETLSCMARSHVNKTGVGPTDDTTEAATWNVENFITVVQEKSPDIDWIQVFRKMDFPHFFLFDLKGFRILVRAWKACPKRDLDFPVNVFFEKEWENTKGQLTALYHIIIAPPDLVNTIKCSNKTVIQAEDFAQSNVLIRNTSAQLICNQLNSLDLIECILKLANTSSKDDVESLVDKVLLKRAPELLFLGALQINPTLNEVHQSIVDRLAPLYLEGITNSVLVLTKFWKTKPKLFIKTMIESYNKEPTFLTRFLAFVHELKILPDILDAKSFIFTIDLAALATRREFLNLEKWLLDKITDHGQSFIQACLSFLATKLNAELARRETNSKPTTVPLSLDVIKVFIKVLMDKVSIPQQEFLTELHRTYAFPKRTKTWASRANDSSQQKRMNLEKPLTLTKTPSPTLAASSVESVNATFRPEIENEANSYYERIYSGEITIADMMDRLRKFNTSNDTREQELYACMVHNLFDEYSFFSKYPEKELALTSVLFGQIIQNQLLSYTSLGVALRCILDALTGNTPDSKLYNFGVQALKQCQSRLSEWPPFCAHLIQIRSLQQTNPELVQVAMAAIKAAKSQQPQLIADDLPFSDSPNTNSENDNLLGDFNPVDSKATVVFRAIQVPEVVGGASNNEKSQVIYQDPSEGTQDKILFIINNVALNNLNTKSEELQKHLKESAYQWFSNYLVVKRTSIEPNYHELYLLLLKSINNRLLYQHVLRETIANIKVLLNSENTVSSSNERALLKNLGSWLGGLTIAQNKPIKQKYISFKDLLLEGYDNDRLIVVIPFVCKVLEQGAKSTVFVPPNPWVMAILKLLVELYENANLRLNLKFAIEVLCKTLSIELNTIEPTDILETRKLKDKHFQMPSATTAVTARLENNTTPGNMPFAGSPFAMPLGALMDPTSANNAAVQHQPSLAGLTSPTSAVGEMSAQSMTIPNIANYVIFNPQLAMYIAAEPQFKRWAIMGITQAIQEILVPTVRRAVGISTVSTRELVTKDFCMEGDEIKFRTAAQTMAQALAGKLAMVTCQEHLNSSMLHHLVSIFTTQGISDAVAEQISLVLIADNLEIGSAIIEKMTIDKVTVDLDESLAAAYTSRRRHREQQQKHGVLQPYYDMNVLSSSSYPTTLPEPLRPSPLGLQPSQLRIYDDFTRIARNGSSTALAANQLMDQQQPMSPVQLSQQQRFNRTPGMDMDRQLNGSAAAAFNDQFVDQSYDTTQQQLVNTAVTAQQLLERFAQYINELESMLSIINVPSLTVVPVNHTIFSIIRQVPLLIIASPDKVEIAKGFAQRVIQLLYKSDTPISQEVYVLLLENICNACPEVGALVTPWLSRADDERKYNVAVTVALIKNNLINLQEHDQELAALIDAGHLTAVEFAARLIRACLFGSMPPVRTRYDFRASLEALNRLRGNIPDNVLLLMEDIRRSALSSNTPVGSHQTLPMLHPTPPPPPPGSLPSKDEENTVHEHMRILFSEWVRIYPTATEKIVYAFTTQLSQQSIFKSASLSSMFYRVCIEESINYALNHHQITGDTALLAYQPIDAFSKLITSLLTLDQPPIIDGTDQLNGTTMEDARHNFFKRIMVIVVLVLSKHHEQLQERFDQRPFLRLFTSFFTDLHSVEDQLQSDYIPILISISNALYTLQPSRYPGFAFGWVQLIPHRLFMPKLLLSENQQGWPAFHRLCTSLFQFQQPHLNRTSLSNTAHTIYRGTLRVLLVLLHDFPEFLCDYHYSLCDVIPISCVQMRNLVLSAFPRNMRLPDPFTPNLKVDLLPEINHSPTILSDYAAMLKTDNYDLKKEIDCFFENASPDGSMTGFDSFVKQLKSYIVQKSNNDMEVREQQQQTEHNKPLTNAIIFYIGLKGVTNGIPVSQGPPVQIYQHLLDELDSEGRYLLLSAIANQLRYPNSHTHYFSCVVLYLFVESKNDAVKEQITRILLERLIVNRPHPWGLLITFIELIKNPRYSFWNHSFTRCATDIERLFESVSKSISQI